MEASDGWKKDKQVNLGYEKVIILLSQEGSYQAESSEIAKEITRKRRQKHKYKKMKTRVEIENKTEK